MARVQVKQQNLIGKDLQAEFNNILGFGDVDTVIVSELCPKMIKSCQEYVLFTNHLLDKMIRPCNQLGENAVKELVTTFRTMAADFVKGGKYSEIKANSGMASPLELEMLNKRKQSLAQRLAQHSVAFDPVHLTEVWRGIKNGEFLKFVILTTNSIKQLLNAEGVRTGKKNLTMEEEINFNFIRNAPAEDASIFGYNEIYINLTLVLNYAEDMDRLHGSAEKINSQFLYKTLRLLYSRGRDIYKMYVTPDINVKNFAKVLVESLVKLKLEISNCDRAFSVMEKSVKMLEDKFPEYYERVMITGNTAIIIEGYVEDLMQRGDVQSDPITKGQMDRLIKGIGEKVRSGVANGKTDNKKYLDLLNNYGTK